MEYLLGILIWLGYLYLQIPTIYAGDSGGLVAAAYTWGFAHPPGYPLYSLLGAILSHLLPFQTVAWRVGLLSSVFTAGSAIFVVLIVRFLTGSRVFSLLAALLYALLYPVWMYAIVPEVFGMYSFFASLLLYLFLVWERTKKPVIPVIFAFAAGMSLTHHHLIVLLLGALFFTLSIRCRSAFVSLRKDIFRLIPAFAAGFSFYLYAPIASSFHPPFDIEHPANLSGFFRLITRAAYGTFRASQGSGQTFMDRTANVSVFFHYLQTDFTWLGILLAVIGFFSLWRLRRTAAIAIGIAFGLQVFYFFYAGFPLVSDFSLGTLERFFIIAYMFTAICWGAGLFALARIIGKVLQRDNGLRVLPNGLVPIILVLIGLTVIIRQIGMNYPRLAVLKNDRTLERLAADIFRSVPEHSIVGVSDDTSTFAADHAYYVLKMRPDIKFITYPLLVFPYYREYLQRTYPDLSIPPASNKYSFDEYVNMFLHANYPKFPVFAERERKQISDERWIPRGMLVQFYPDAESVPAFEDVEATNTALFRSFSDPSSQSLSKYRNLMLSDALRYYSDKRLAFANYLLTAGEKDKSLEQLLIARSLYPERLELYPPIVSILSSDGQCNRAMEILASVPEYSHENVNILSAYHTISTDCPEFRSRVSGFEQRYLKQKESTRNIIR